MSTSSGKKARRSQSNETQINGFKALKPQNFAQAQYLESIQKNPITFGIGSAGTGKTYIATAYAAEQLYYKRIDKIILTRPAVEAAGESLGFLPGELIEGKLLPYMIPYLETLNDLLGKSFVEYNLKVGNIEPVPLAYMRGRSFKNCLIIADEMQSATSMQMKLLLTRIGVDTKIVINGDTAQRDTTSTTGLEDASVRLSHLPEVEVVRFFDNDCVRSGICKKILNAYA
jgi:phosphate starvation-inducible PhoH-like protein